MRLPLTLRNFIANLKFERDDALDIRGSFAVELNIVPTVVAAKCSTIGAEVRTCQSDIRHGVGNEKIRFEINSPAMNLLHSLEIANLDNAFIRRELGEPLQRLLAARVGENCRRKEPLGLSCRLHVRQCRRRYGPFGRGFLRNGLTDLRCTGPGLGCSRSNRRQVHYFNGDAFLRERNWGSGSGTKQSARMTMA